MEIYTLSSMALLMTKLATHPSEPGEALKVTGPAAGSNTLVLTAAPAPEDRAVSHWHRQVVATDLNSSAVDMALVNLGLAGVPAVVRHGNSLTGQSHRESPTPAWPFAHPYSREPGSGDSRGVDVLDMLRWAVLPPLLARPLYSSVKTARRREPPCCGPDNVFYIVERNSEQPSLLFTADQLPLQVS